MEFVVTQKPTTNNGTNLDDQGFVGGNDRIEFTVTSVGTTPPGLDAILVRQFLQANNQIPREGAVHPGSLLSVLRSVTLTALSPIYYEGTLNYEAVRRPQDQTDENQNPWDQPASFKFSSVTSDLPIDSDYDGNPIVNPGTCETVSGVTAPISDLLITITRNFQTLTPTAIANFSNKINSDTFLGFAPGLCKTGDITADPSIHNGVTYYSVVVPVMVRAIYGGVVPERAWWFRRILKGYYEIIDGPDDAQGNPTMMKVRACDDEDQPTTVRVLLDAQGRRLAPGAPPVYIETRRHGTIAFNGLGLL